LPNSLEKTRIAPLFSTEQDSRESEATRQLGWLFSSVIKTYFAIRWDILSGKKKICPLKPYRRD